MILTDTHTHLYSDSFAEDRSEMIERAISSGIKRMFMPNVDFESVNGLVELLNQFPGNLFGMMGLHPCSVEDDYKTVLAKLKKEAEKIEIVAIGEIGLDLFWKKTNLPEQTDAFVSQIEWAKSANLPIVIHSRDAIDETIKILQSLYDSKLKGVMHCFTGNALQAKKITDLGFYLGIGGVATFKNSGLNQVLKTIGTDFLVLETDAPYIAPVPFRGKRNESSYLLNIAEHVANVLEMKVELLAEITTLNSIKLFGI